jgi:hypothetical protein
MNPTLEAFARQQLIDGLGKLPNGWVRLFKLMYGRHEGERSIEEAAAMDIAAVVAEMPADKLDWALSQVENSLRKLATYGTVD